MHDANAAYVQQLRVSENASDEEIQAALSKLFQRRSESSDGQGKSVLKMSVNSESQKTEHMLDQISSGPSRPQPEISSVIQDQEPEIKSKLSVLRSGIIIDSSLKNRINSLLKEESLYSDIFVELDSGKNELKRKGEVYRRKRGLLVVHQEGQDSDIDYWRVIIPDDVFKKFCCD